MVPCHKLNFIIHISLKPVFSDILNLDYFIQYRIQSSKYLRSTTFGCKAIGIRKLEFVAKTQFL